jgi:MoxR-like ATPase
LLEGVPGIAKTLAAKLMARSVSAPFSRIQFTPDLMPADILGTSVFDPKTTAFSFKKGPVFSNIILIDEINRAPAKTQAALFEVMEERQITVDGVTYPMPPPFMVLATQNPIEHEGTYRLPEAQLDRFLFKLEVTYPSLDEEVGILSGHYEGRTGDNLEIVEPVMSAGEILEFQRLIRRVHVEARLLTYIAELVQATRNNEALYLGASPRASLAILRTSMAMAAVEGRDFITPADIQIMAKPVLRHRLILTPEQEMEGRTTDQVVDRLMERLEVPR